MSIMITKNGYEKLKQELNRLVTIERPMVSQTISETRPIGILGDNPEYLEALKAQTLVESKINTLSNVLSDIVIFDETMIQEGVVSFGSTVSFIDYETDIEKDYTIVSMYESDVNNGLISYQAPFIKSMIGLQVGDSFVFNDKEYEITNISYKDLSSL